MKENKYIRVGKAKIEIVDQDAINDAADDGMIYACMPCHMGPAAIPGARTIPCDICGNQCWISPATYSAWQSSGGPIACIECCLKKVREHGQDGNGTEGAVEAGSQEPQDVGLDSEVPGTRGSEEQPDSPPW